MPQSSTFNVGSGMVVVLMSVLLMLVSFGVNSAQGGCACTGAFTSGNCQGDLVVDGAEDIVRPRHPSPSASDPANSLPNPHHQSSCSLQATVVSISGSLLIEVR